MAKSSGSAKFRKDDASVTQKGDHEVIVPEYNLKTYARNVAGPQDSEEPFDTAVLERAEQALANLSGEFEGWMNEEVAHLKAARQALASADAPENRAALYRTAHDIRGGGATYGYPMAGEMADSLCRLLDALGTAPLPAPLIDQHVDGIIAVVREKARNAGTPVAAALVKELRAATDAQVRAHGGEPAEG